MRQRMLCLCRKTDLSHAAWAAIDILLTTFGTFNFHVREILQ
jgi:hypothetical protein